MLDSGNPAGDPLSVIFYKELDIDVCSLLLSHDF